MKSWVKMPLAALFVGAAAVAVGLSACSSKPLSFGGGAQETKLPPYTVRTLKNGLKIYYVQDNSLPRLSLTALVKTGTLGEPEGKLGVNAMVAYLLNQGSKGKTAVQLADAFGALGTEFSAGPGADQTTFSASSLSTQSNELLALFHEVLTSPAFADAEIEKTRSLALSSLKKRIDNPSGFAGRQMTRFLHTDQGYGRDVLGNSDSLRKLRKVDLIRQYLNNYRPNNTLMAVAGRFDDAFAENLEKLFSTWEAKDVEAVTVAPLAAQKDLQVRLVSKKGLAQTQIRMGAPAVTRANADYLPLRLASEALGGGFGARLMQRIRDDLGLTYSIYSGVSADRQQGVFSISTFTKNETAGRTVDEALAVYEKFANEGITQKELEMAKAQLLGQFPRTLETSDQVAGQLISIDAYGLPLTYLTEFEKNVSRVTLTQVNTAIKTHFAPKGLKVLIYADQAVVGSQLEKFKPEILAAEKQTE